MALSITTSANINDSTSSYDVTVAGKLLSGARVNLDLKIRGVIVASTYTYGTNAYFTGVTASEIYANAAGQSLTGAVEIIAVELNAEEDLPVQSASKIGNITINYRLTSWVLTTPTTSSKINLDLADPTNIVSSWARITTDFVGQIIIQVGNRGDGASTSWTTVYTSGNLTTSLNIDVITAGINDEIIAAMGSVSPKDIRVRLYTRFRTGSSAYTTLGENTPKVVAGAFEKIFFTPSVATINPFTIETDLITNDLPFTLTTYVSGATHELELFVNGVSIKTVSGITASGSLDITATDLANMLLATDQVNTCNAYIVCETTYLGATDTAQSASVVATVGAEWVPSITAHTHAENVTSPDIATIVGLYVKLLSQVKFTTSGSAQGGTRLKELKVTFAGQTKIASYTYASNTLSLTSAQLITDALAQAGSLSAVISLKDWRDRITTYTFTGIVVLDYFFPKVNSVDVVRCDTTTPFEDNALGTFLKVYLNLEVASLINSTERNNLSYRIGYRLTGVGSYTYYTLTDVGALTLNGNVVKGTITTQEFDQEEVYDIIIEVYDELALGTPSVDVLPYGQVPWMLGIREAAVGKVWEKAIFDVGQDDSGESIHTDGRIETDTTFKSNVATGTAPLQVASQTKVDNLNAALLNGKAQGDANGQIPAVDFGTFTPRVGGATTEGTGTYTEQVGRYLKFGNTVFFEIMLVWTAHDGSGNTRIYDLPFTAANGTNGPAVSIFRSGYALTSGSVIQGYVLPNTTTISINQIATGSANNAALTLDTAATLLIGGHYTV